MLLIQRFWTHGSAEVVQFCYCLQRRPVEVLHGESCVGKVLSEHHCQDEWELGLYLFKMLAASCTRDRRWTKE